MKVFETIVLFIGMYNLLTFVWTKWLSHIPGMNKLVDAFCDLIIAVCEIIEG